MIREDIKNLGSLFLLCILVMTLAGCGTGGYSVKVSERIKGDNLFEVAQRFYERKNYTQAESLFNEFLRTNQDASLADDALFRLGQIAMERNNYKSSYRLFKRVTEEYPESEFIPAARFEAIRSLFLDSSWKEALYESEMFRDDFPTSQYDPMIRFMLSEIYIKTREYEKARDISGGLVENYPRSPLKDRALYQQGLSEMRLGETDAAIEHIGLALRGSVPERIKQDALYAMGTLYLIRGDQRMAVEFFSDLVRETGESERRERVFKKVEGIIKGQFTDEELKAIIEDHPEDFPGDLAMIELADRLEKKGKTADSHAYMDRFLTTFPEHPKVFQVQEKKSLLSARGTVEGIGKFGCIAPLSGPLSGYGEKMAKGVKMAIEEYNQKYGTDLKVVLFDSQAKPDMAQKGVELLAQEEKVAAIIGPLLTSTAVSAASVAEEMGIPLFTPTATGEGLPETGGFIFRNCLTNRHQAVALADYAVESLGFTRFGIMFPFNPYGQEMMALFSNHIDELGGNVDIIEFYDPEDTDFKEQLIRINQIRPEALFLPGSYDKIVLIAPQIPFYEPDEDPNDPNMVLAALIEQDAFFDPNVESMVKAKEEKEPIQLLGTDGWYDQRVIKEGESYVEGAILSVGFYPENREPGIRSFVNNFQTRYGDQPDIVSAQAYDATNIILEASEGGTTSWETTRERLFSIKDFPGVSGNTSILPSGDSKKEVTLLEIRRRRFEPVIRSTFNQNYIPSLQVY